ncbi:hypothetical protein HK14_14440 [Acetobacter cibinongensis]|uniref:Uncharacterized protein n=2 Tax=Acetobacter cibinongensis TaxID=146475 RepID=A0A1Z5YRJ0_9PROT|nr:hypothetical protein HK14_14440 [Acetobacter cibinongensis]
MRCFLLAPLAMAIFLPSAYAQSDKEAITQAHWRTSEQARPVTPSDTEVLKATPDLKRAGEGYRDMCDTSVTPKILLLDIGGTLGTVSVVIEEDSFCFGGDGAQYTVLDKGHRVLWHNSAAGIAPLESRHAGVRDLIFAGPGMKVPIWIWKAAEHRFVLRTVVDTE